MFKTFADINMNYGVSAILKKIKVKNKHVCQFYKGNNNIKELSKLEYQYEFSIFFFFQMFGNKITQ